MIAQNANKLPELKRGYAKNPPLFTVEENIGCSTLIHQIIMDEVGRVMAWRPGECALRGGGALHYGHGSVRMSNDLNFLIADDRAPALLKALNRIMNRVTGRLHEIAGGVAKVRHKLEICPSSYTDASLLTVNLSWTHPHRRGAVEVVTEFYPARRESLQLYKAKPILMSMALIRCAGQMPVLAGTVIGLWADKIQSIASRENMKWRDLFDLGYIATNSVEFAKLMIADKAAALVTASHIQGLPIDMVAGALLARRDEIKRLVAEAELKGDTNAYVDDLKRWFDRELYTAMTNSGLLMLYLDSALKEVDAIVEHLKLNPIQAEKAPESKVIPFRKARQAA